MNGYLRLENVFHGFNPPFFLNSCLHLNKYEKIALLEKHFQFGMRRSS